MAGHDYIFEFFIIIIIESLCVKKCMHGYVFCGVNLFYSEEQWQDRDPEQVIQAQAGSRLCIYSQAGYVKLRTLYFKPSSSVSSIYIMANQKRAVV